MFFFQDQLVPFPRTMNWLRKESPKCPNSSLFSYSSCAPPFYWCRFLWLLFSFWRVTFKRINFFCRLKWCEKILWNFSFFLLFRIIFVNKNRNFPLINISEVLKSKFFFMKNLIHSHTFFHPKNSLPFDQKSWPGFFTGILIELIAGWKFSVVLCAIDTFYIGICWYVEACINDMQKIFNEIDAYIMENDGDENNDGHLTKFNLKRSLLEAVDFHKKILR